MNKNINLFTTYNLNLSSVLIACGVKLEKTEINEAGKVLFCFKSSNELLDIHNKYWRKELRCEPQYLFDSMKFLKNRIYSRT